MTEFTIKDSGERTEFAGGMVRDSSGADKTDYTSVMFGPMLERWAVHCTKGRLKYEDPFPGIPNWTLASGVEEFLHARGSLLRHLMAYLRGETDEDHAAAIMFNVNVMEYVRGILGAKGELVPEVFDWRITQDLGDPKAAPEAEWGTPVDLSGKPFEPFDPCASPSVSVDEDGKIETSGDLDMTDWKPCGPECCEEPCYEPEPPRLRLMYAFEVGEPFGGGAPDE